MKLAFTTLGCPDWTLDQVLAGAKEYGFDGVDFRGCDGVMDLWTLPEFSTALPQTAERIRSAGLAVPCVSSSGRLLVDDAAAREASLDGFARFVDIGAALGADKVRVFGGFNGERSEADARREAAEMLDPRASPSWSKPTTTGSPPTSWSRCSTRPPSRTAARSGTSTTPTPVTANRPNRPGPT